MALRSTIRSAYLWRCRLFSTSILNSDSKTPLSSKEKSRAALSLLRFEKNPERILDICRAAALTPESHLDRVAYSKAISKLRESHYYEGIRGLVMDSLSQPDFKSERFVRHFIVLLGQAGILKDAINLFDEMPKLGVDRSIKALNSLLISCVLAGEYGELKRIFADFPSKYNLQPDLETYNNALKGLCESGSSNAAYSLLADMERNNIKPNTTTFSVLMAGFYKEKKLSDVEKTTDLMNKHGVLPGIAFYNTKIMSLCKLQKSSEAKAVLDYILSKKMKPNCVTYNHLIHGFCKEGDLDLAKKLFKQMNDRKLKPESSCYFTLIYFLCQGRDFESALGICKDSISKGWVPNISTMRSLVNGLVSIEKVDEAREIISVVKEKFSRNADRWSEIEEGLPK
ncbi:hypothetical protein M569_09725 [Genlisea aurea]|uniref:Pentacotripeptide-repeat region of PRORP domain-containing protein n=1 Tax=Genlisea aurea TaxID=192259 RepID=S8DPP5_9LAMI|nr:hypothetical protein M569_09725 [Genlisea aurea]